ITLITSFWCCNSINQLSRVVERFSPNYYLGENTGLPLELLEIHGNIDRFSEDILLVEAIRNDSIISYSWAEKSNGKLIFRVPFLPGNIMSGGKVTFRLFDGNEYWPVLAPVTDQGGASNKHSYAVDGKSLLYFNTPNM